MSKRPSRIDLLELDIDLRLTDLWREAADVSEWSLEIVAAFMRAAYGKGYCDALTEDQPGSLCEEHGYRIRAAPRTLARSLLKPGARLRRGAPFFASPSRHRARDRGDAGRLLVYNSIAGGTPQLRPSELNGRTGEVALMGKVIGRPSGDAHGSGLRFQLRDVEGTASVRSPIAAPFRTCSGAVATS